MAASKKMALALALVVLGAGTSMAQYYPGYPQPIQPILPPTPAYPILQTPTHITGVNPFTGGLNTGGTTVLNSVNAPGRMESIGNGSAQFVTRPVVDQFGRVTGYQQGVAWTNSLTGQEHFQGNVVTPNGLGGSNTQKLFYGGNPNAKPSPSGTPSYAPRSYSPRPR